MANALQLIHGIGTHANRPAATALGAGALYSCTDHNLIYQTDGATWSTWATLAAAGLTVEEADASPTDSAVTKIVFPNGTLGIASHVVTYTPRVIGCRATKSSTQSLNSSAYPVLVAFNGTDAFDTDNIHDPSTNNSRFTAPIDGYYCFKYQVSFEANATGERHAFVYFNGATDLSGPRHKANDGGAPTYLTGAIDLQMTAGQYVEVGAYQNSGGARNIETTSKASLFKF